MQCATDIAAYTCSCCPLGCRVEVALDENGQVSEVSGYTCKRGADYAAQEAVAPERMVTAVLPVSGCLEPVSAKTQRPVPKAAMKDVRRAGRGRRRADRGRMRHRRGRSRHEKRMLIERDPRRAVVDGKGFRYER